jgi:apolipoprotein N-acyltransferase
MDDQDRKYWTQTANLAQREHDGFSDIATQTDAYLVVGALSKTKQPKGSDPSLHQHNSAFVYAPGGVEPKRYDKIHLVLFGEYVPFRYSKRLKWLYHFLNDGPWNPWGQGGYEYSLTAGEDFTTFPMRARSQDDAEYTFGVTICYEDVIPQVFSQFVIDPDTGEKRASFMLNISNDGWFGRGSQQPQHLVSCAFRAVENRVGVARAVNTGVSGFIRPDGSWHDLAGPSKENPRAGGIGCPVARLIIDPRVTFYSRFGDVFALGCTLVAAGFLVDALIARRREKKRREPPSERKAKS